MRIIVSTNQFKKDLRLALKRNLPEAEIAEVIDMLAKDIPLPIYYRDHELKGDYKGARECHIRPDWLLIYEKSDTNDLKIITLIRTGSHSDLF